MRGAVAPREMCRPRPTRAPEIKSECAFTFIMIHHRIIEGIVRRGPARVRLCLDAVLAESVLDVRARSVWPDPISGRVVTLFVARDDLCELLQVVDQSVDYGIQATCPPPGGSLRAIVSPYCAASVEHSHCGMCRITAATRHTSPQRPGIA